MRRAYGVIASAIAALTITSCQSYLQTEHFRIDTEPAVPKAAKRIPLTLLVNTSRSPSRYQDQIFYRSSEYEVGFYEYSRWVEQPSEMVTRALINALDASGLFESVVLPGGASNPDLILQTAITSFDQVVSKEGNSAECSLTMSILHGGSGKAVWQYKAKAVVKQNGKFAAAMSEAVAEVIRKAIADMEASAALEELAAAKTG